MTFHIQICYSTKEELHMKIKVLGCSNSWTTRFTSCYLLNDNILIDCGADAYKKYMQTGKDLSEIDLILISHFHADHVFGLNVFLSRIQRKVGKRKSKLTIAGLKGIRKTCEFVFEACNLFHHDFGEDINFIELDDGDSFQFDNLKIQAYKLDHGDVEDLGFTITENDKTFGYTGDTTYIPKLDTFIDLCDLCFVEVSRQKTNAKHMGADKFRELMKTHTKTKLRAVHCDEDVYVLKDLQAYMAHEDDVYEL